MQKSTKSSHHRLRLQNYLLDQVLLLALQGRQEGCTHLSTVSSCVRKSQQHVGTIPLSLTCLMVAMESERASDG